MAVLSGGEWRAMAALLFYLCATAFVMEALIPDREGAFGFRSACALAVALCLIRALIGLLGPIGSM